MSSKGAEWSYKMQHYIDTEESSAPELDDAVRVAEAALNKVKP